MLPWIEVYNLSKFFWAQYELDFPIVKFGNKDLSLTGIVHVCNENVWVIIHVTTKCHVKQCLPINTTLILNLAFCFIFWVIFLNLSPTFLGEIKWLICMQTVTNSSWPSKKLIVEDQTFDIDIRTWHFLK